ncbi:hypothetical protein HDF16_002797 [Granulicella aggregans]|uniref:Bacterial Ig-like domain-containing protein n=1 Tax=Granulicella aggregans TaxID=474949 RepID=A0A7W7ZEV8_9BACT|nr:Ig-like domain repeat protein [Granulicella aggregans]MBB5058091.1 hypothetical protein [Granulicella aggregans]
MQADASAKASPQSTFNGRHNSIHLVKLLSFQELVIGALIPKSWQSALLGLCVLVASISAFQPVLLAQTGNVVISTNTTYPTGTYNLTSLSVENGATLTVGGGSTVTVSGAILVTANSNVVLQSVNNASQVNGTWQGTGVTVNAGSVQVDAGSSINADGQGYVANAGPAGAAAGSSAGGSYGGLGGTGAGTAAGAIYGMAATPTDLGSGGGSRCCGAIAGTGGGAIRLIVSGTLTDNGVISANGGNLVGYQGGGGGGGSVYVTTAGLAGAGVFSATGGTGGEAAGGGGRIAVYYNAAGSSFTGFSASTAVGGSCQTQCSNGTASAGGTGTSAFFDTSATNNNLSVYQSFTIPAGATHSLNAITVQAGATLSIGGGSTINVAGAVTVSGTLVGQAINNSAQVSGSWQGSGVTLHAASVVVNAGGSINADGQGYVAGAGPGGAPSGSSAGGSYGGLGGVGDGVSPGPIYGSTTAPTDLGSGGNTRCCGTIPGAGGGALTITVSGTLTDNGVISANGGDGVGLQVGGGSGGTVSIQTATLTGSGSVAANAGSGGEAGGGGGRVALYYNTNNGFDTAMVTSNGGASSGGNPGAVGTVYTLGAGSNLTVSDNTTLPPNANLSFNSVTVNNAATLTVGSGTTLASHSVTVTGGGNFTVGGGSTLNISGEVLVTGDSKMVLQSINNAAQVNGAWRGAGVTINAGSVQVDAGSSINADGQGYLASAGPGGALAGSSAGGSYGGMGGSGSGPTPAGPIYGSDTTPTDLGSGGGSRCCGAVAGNGGGAIRLIVSGTLTDNGAISANGANLVGYQGGGGSGGSVWVTTAGLAGLGVFTANGGTGGEAAGGGGRIAVYYNAPTSSFTGFSTSTSNGASCGTQCSNGAASAGAVGTVGFFDTSATNSNLMVDQDLTIPAGTTVAYNSITVQPNAVLTIGGGSTVTVAGSLTVSGTVVAQSINNTALVNGTWQGSGVTLNVAEVVVNANGSINADGQGYVPSAGPGGAAVGTSAGGSYGGAGGTGDGSASAATYGSASLPVDLGSGGGLRCCSTSAGAGGGALFFNVSGTLTNNGTISANGAAIVGYQAGGGSGGTVYVKTAGLSGAGAFTANGGLGGEAGGGGGRVAIYYDAPSSNFTGFSASTASGGGCGTQCTSATASPGSNGTSAFFDTSATNNNLAVYQNFTVPAGASPTYNNVTVQSGALLTIGGGATVTVTKALTVSGTVVAQSANNTAQVNDVWVGSGVAISAGSINVNAAGSLNADTQGYVANAGPGGSPAGTSAGGSYGGLGGVGDGAAPSPIYGSLMLPVDLGSGGGSRCCGTIPGPGGGALLLTVSGTLTDDGVISANGGDGSGLQVGGGSGGSVSIHTAALAGSGSIAANGGGGGEAGGGGGRVALYFNTNGFNLTLATATGGSSDGGNAGAVGTVYIPGPVTSTTALSASSLQLSAGQAASFQAVVTAAPLAPTVPGPTPTGTVNFLDGTTVIGTQALSASQESGTAMAQFQTTALAVGTHSITASYSGGNVEASTSAAQTVSVGQATSATTLGVSAANITAGQAETLTATVTDLTSPAITGSVTFFDGTTSLGNGTLTVSGATGIASLTVRSLGVGSHSITARYGGDTNYIASSSGAQIVTVTGTAQTITFPAIPNHVYGDAPFVLTATASSGLDISYSVVSGPATVVGSTVTVTGVGTVTIQAAQAGNTTYAAATPVSRSFLVSAPGPTLASISPTIGIVGSGATVVTLTGTNFASTDTVQLNGTAVPSTLVSATSLTATLPATFFAGAGTGLITVADSVSKTVTAAATFTVAPAPQFVLSGPSTASSGEQPALNFTLTNPYPFPLAGALTLTFAPVASAKVTGDPAVQFATGGQVIDFSIPANSTATPAVQLQTGTIAGTATVTLAVTSNGADVTPADVAPVVITIPAAVPTLNSARMTKSGETVTVAVVGFSNTREVTQAVFHFTPVAGSLIKDPDVTIDVSAVFARWYGSAPSDAYGSAFTYTQPFTLDSDATSIAGVAVTLTNSVGVSVLLQTQ